jgi:hypothetical protein
LSSDFTLAFPWKAEYDLSDFNFLYLKISLKVHKIEIFLASILKFVLFLYQLCENIKILLKKFLDQAIIGGDTIFPLSLRLSGIEFSLVWD